MSAVAGILFGVTCLIMSCVGIYWYRKVKKGHNSVLSAQINEMASQAISVDQELAGLDHTNKSLNTTITHPTQTHPETLPSQNHTPQIHLS